MTRFWMAVATGALAAGLVSGQVELSEMTGFRVPEYDKDGNKKSELTGDFAKVNKEGDVEITNLRMEIYKDDKIDILVSAPQCTYNQKKGVAFSREALKMERDSLLVTGRGFAYSHTNGIFKIFSDARVVILNAREQAEFLGGKR